MIHSVTDGEKFLVKRFLWKAETVLFDQEGNEKIMLLFLIFCMSIFHRLDIYCAVTCGCSAQTTMLFSHPKRTLVLQGPKWDFGSAGHQLQHVCTDKVPHHLPFSTVSSLHVVHTISNLFRASCLTLLLVFVNCVMPSVSLLSCITKRKNSLAMYDCLCVCVCVIIILLCSCVVLRWCQLNT